MLSVQEIADTANKILGGSNEIIYGADSSLDEALRPAKVRLELARCHRLVFEYSADRKTVKIHRIPVVRKG